MAPKGGSSIFTFLKEALTLPTRNLKLFVQITACIIALNLTVILVNVLAIQPLNAKILLDANNVKSIIPASSEDDVKIQLEALQKDTKLLFIILAAYLIVTMAVSSVVVIITYYATTATYSGERLTLCELLRKAKGTFKGPLVTLAVSYLLQFVLYFFITVLIVVGVFLIKYSMFWFFVVLVFLCPLLLFSIYFSIACTVSIIVSVVETDCNGFGAISRAWRLMKGRKKLVFAIIIISLLLGLAIGTLHAIATNYGAKSMSIALLSGFVYALLSGFIVLFINCALTVYYFECEKGQEDEVAFAKLSLEDVHV